MRKFLHSDKFCAFELLRKCIIQTYDRFPKEQTEQ